MPLITIITVCYNNLKGLDETVKSVLAQTMQDYEFLVIDGASTDGTRTYLESLDQRVRWVSEKDQGIFHAMNKGIAAATGEYLLFLNSGDHLLQPETLSQVQPYLNGTAVVYGDQMILEEEDRYPDQLSFGYFFGHGTLPHQASFIHQRLFREYGTYDEGCRICADTIFFMNVICRYNASYRHMPVLVARVNRDGISSQGNSWTQIRKEITNCFQRDFPAFLADYEELEQLRGSIKRSRLVKTLNKVGLLKALKY